MAATGGSESAIGTARIDVEVDTSQFDSAIAAAKRSVADMSSAAQQQYQQLSGAEKRRVDNLIKQADVVSLNRQQQIAYAAALRTEGPLLDEITRKLARNTGEVEKQGISLKQQQAAMRGVPAQITDIFVSLQGGQHPMTVLLQQGGQLKDMFGGIAPAAQALGAQLLVLINPATIAAGALAMLAYAGTSYMQQEAGFRNALLATGQYAGVSADEFERLVRTLDGLEGVSRGGASAALTQVAASGRFAGEQFDIVAKSAAVMEANASQSVDTTIAKFEEIAKSPVDALLKLNETEHFLTRAQLERIAALEEEGRKTEAVAEATRIYGEHLHDLATSSRESMSALSRWWQQVKDDTSGAIGEIGRYIDLTDQLIAKRTGMNRGAAAEGASLLTPIAGQLRMGGAFLRVANDWAARRNGLDTPARLGASFQDVTGRQVGDGEIVDSPASKKAREDRKKAEDEWNRWQAQNLSKKEKQQAEERRIQAAGDAIGKKQSEIDAQIAASRQRFAEAEKKSAGSKTTDPVVALAQRIKQQIALNTEQLQSEAKLTTSQRLRIQVEQELLNLGPKATAEQRAAIKLQLEELESSGALVAQHEREAKAKEQLVRLNAQIAVSEQNRLRGNALDLMGYGRGGDAVDMLRRQLDIQREYEDGLKRVRDSGVAADTESWRQQEAELRASRDRMLDAERDYQNQRLALMADWRVGANAALEDYLFSAADVASQSRDLFATAFGGAEDAIRQFTKTGKLEFSDLADSIIADLTRIAAKQMIAGLFGNALSGWLGGSVTGTGNALVSSGTQSINANLSKSLMRFGGGRASGGRVRGDSFYEVGEGGRPELFEQNGRKYLIPGNSGEVFPAVPPVGRQPVMSAGQSGGGGWQVVINNNAPAKVTAQEQQTTGPNGEVLRRLIIDVAADDMASGGKLAQATKGRLDVGERL